MLGGITNQNLSLHASVATIAHAIISRRLARPPGHRLSDEGRTATRKHVLGTKPFLSHRLEIPLKRARMLQVLMLL